jgi:hypothetical protein
LRNDKLRWITISMAISRSTLRAPRPRGALVLARTWRPPSPRCRSASPRTVADPLTASTHSMDVTLYVRRPSRDTPSPNHNEADVAPRARVAALVPARAHVYEVYAMSWKIRNQLLMTFPW